MTRKLKPLDLDRVWPKKETDAAYLFVNRAAEARGVLDAVSVARLTRLQQSIDTAFGCDIHGETKGRDVAVMAALLAGLDRIEELLAGDAWARRRS